jgi:glycosyltransferase involved in cell wall biosynthesis
MPGSVAVVPCFNDGGTLEAAVASVQDQDVPAEIIVVDDGATDSATVAAYERLDEADALPLSPKRKRLLGGAMTHIAYGNSWRMLVARYRANRVVQVPDSAGSRSLARGS